MAKTPTRTLAQLQKLAKRKWQTGTGENGVVKLVEQGNVVARAMASALSALPDKGGPRG